MVVVITKSGIKLPFMGKDKFVELMKAGLRYDRQTKTFFIESLDYLEKVKNILSEQLKDEVTFAQICYICDSIFPCSPCAYRSICRSSDIPSYCICAKCESKPELYQLYLKKSQELLKDNIC